MQMESNWIHHRAPPFFFLPYFGAGAMGFGGAGKLQPIFVSDVAHAFVDALESRKTVGEIYPIAGPHVLTWPELHHACAHMIGGGDRWVLPIPAWAAKVQTHLLPASLLGFNRDQVMMSQEDNTCDLAKFKTDFGWEPRPFGETLREYAGQLG
jgi:nucleoside-diphosphate-sugar epimerase